MSARVPVHASSLTAARRTRRPLALVAAALAALPCVGAAQPLESQFSGYVTITTDYRRRGLSVSGSDPSLQVGADFQHRSGFFAGLWAAQIEVSWGGDRGSSTRHETGYYAGYTHQTPRWSWTGAAARYTYPGSGLDYSYNELSGTLDYRGRLFVTAAFLHDLFSHPGNGWYGEIGFALPLPHALELGASIGKLHGDEPLDYTHWNVGVSRSFGQRIGIDLRRYETSGYYANAVATTEGDAWVATASYAFGRR